MDHTDHLLLIISSIKKWLNESKWVMQESSTRVYHKSGIMIDEFRLSQVELKQNIIQHSYKP